MREIYVHNLTKTKFDLKLLKNIVKTVCHLRRIKQEEIGIILLDDQKIQEYNLKYRGADRATDVLAFSVDEKTGELFISLESARKQARVYRQSLKKELSLLAIHGLLHLNGYDDTTQKSRMKMRKEEKAILNLVETIP